LEITVTISEKVTESYLGKGPIRCGGDRLLAVSKNFPDKLAITQGIKVLTYTNSKGVTERYHIDPNWPKDDCAFFRSNPGDTLNLNHLLKGHYEDVTITLFMKLLFKAELVVTSVELIFDLHQLIHEVGWNRSSLTARIGDEEDVQWDILVIPYIIDNLKPDILLSVYRFSQETHSEPLKKASMKYLERINKFKVLTDATNLQGILPNETHFEELFKLLISPDVFPKIMPFSEIVTVISNYFTTMNDATRYLKQIDFEHVEPKDSTFLNAFDHPDLNGIKIKLMSKRIENLESQLEKVLKKVPI